MFGVKRRARRLHHSNVGDVVYLRAHHHPNCRDAICCVGSDGTIDRYGIQKGVKLWCTDGGRWGVRDGRR